MHHTKHRSRFVKQCRILLCLFACISVSQTSSAEIQTTESIRAAVESSISQHLSGIYGAEKVSSDVVINVGNLDSRLALQACPEPLTTRLQQSHAGSQNVSVKVKCTSGKRWSIYVPAKIEVYEPVAVSTRNVRPGTQINRADYVFKRSNVSMMTNQFITQASELDDKIVKRPIRAGAVIRLSDLGEPMLVKKGETVALYARNGSLQVTTKGKALSSGQLGEAVKVQNIKSKRVIEAKVVAAGAAEAFSW